MTRQMNKNSDSFRMLFQGGITSIHNRQYPEKVMANKSRLHLQLNSSTAESANAIATDFDAQFINAWIKTKFHIAQSDNDESSRAKSVEHFQLLPGFIQLQELQVTSRPAIPSVKPIKRRRVHNRERFRLRLNDEF